LALIQVTCGRAALAKVPDEQAWAEARFEGIAYQLLARRRRERHLVFRLGVALRPGSMRAHDHVAETYARADHHDHAVAAYRDVLACAARDTKLGTAGKETLRRKALAKLKELGANLLPAASPASSP